MKKILLSSLGLFVGFLSFSQVPVVYYDFEVNASRSNSWEATVELAVNAGNSAFTRAGLGSFTQAAGAGSLYGGNMGRAIMGDRWPTSSTNPGALATEYFQFSANTEGLFGLSMVFDVAKSGTGPRAMGITYSLDGITFMPLTSLAISGGFSNTIVPLPVALENRSKVTFRLYGYNAQNGSGDLSIDNMQLSATGISGVKTLFDFDAYANSLSSGSPGAQKLTGDLSIMGVGTIITLNSSVNLSGLISVATGSTFRLGVDASLTGASKLDLADGSTLQISSTDQRSAIKGNIGNTILKTFPNAIIEFIGSTGQVQDAATLPNVVVNNPNGVTHTGEVVINGNLTLKNGTMKPGAYKMTINGNIAKTSGTIDASNSELVFNGTTEQTVAADAFAGPVKRMNVNNPGGVAMNSDVTVSEELNLTKGRLKIGTKKLTIRGALSRDGIAETGDIDAQNGTVEFGGTAVQAVPPGSFQNNKCKGLRISNTHIDGVSLNGALDVTTVLDFGTVNNSKLKTNGNLTLKSDATGTARIGDLTNGGVNSGNDIIGTVTVERHTPAASSRRYRVVTSPVSGISINEAWQEGGKWNGSTANPANGFGTLITGQAQGTATKANSNGFDYW
ncbi:MAG: hypothetical protein M3Q06_03000, partial [Bacteroidota bacterium]|nr:hypothetical protein [Bacteroidota bacterium]